MRRVCFYLLLVVCLSTMACTGQPFRSFGRINLNSEIGRAFESCSVNVDFRYYVSGPNESPNAVIGLHQDYRIDPKSLWKEVEMTPTTMRKIVDNMKERSSNRLLFLYGFELLDPKGKSVGVWYSIATAPTCLQIKDDGTVRIDTPDLDTYQELDGEMGPHPISG
jgi:hypothetical protein